MDFECCREQLDEWISANDSVGAVTHLVTLWSGYAETIEESEEIWQLKKKYNTGSVGNNCRTLIVVFNGLKPIALPTEL